MGLGSSRSLRVYITSNFKFYQIKKVAIIPRRQNDDIGSLLVTDRDLQRRLYSGG